MELPRFTAEDIRRGAGDRMIVVEQLTYVKRNKVAERKMDELKKWLAGLSKEERENIFS